MHAIRTRFAKDIVAEVMPPKKKSRKVLIYCGGFPGSPCKKPVMRHYAQKGFWVVYPRHRGMWESDGKLFERSPHEDLIDVIKELPYGFTDLYTREEYTIDPGEIYLLGVSFGGAAVLLASQDKRVRKVVALSPVVDWTVESETEPATELERFAREGFGPAFRIHESGWEKVRNGKLFQPKAALENLDPNKILILHAQDDKVVPGKTITDFVQELGCKLQMKPTGGHYGSKHPLKRQFSRKILRFFKK